MSETLVELITSMKESLEREMQSLRNELRDGFAKVDERFDRIEIRLDRQEVDPLRTDKSCPIERLTEKVDLLAARDKRINELEVRVKN